MNYSNLLQKLQILKIGTRKDQFPIYAQYVQATEKYLFTSNDDICVHIPHDCEFIGDTNIYVLDNTLKLLGDNAEIKVVDSIIEVTDGDFHSKLILSDMGFPKVTESDVETITITEELYNLLRLAIKFIGVDEDKYLVLGNGWLYATNGYKCLTSSSTNTTNILNIAIDRNILSILSIGDRIGNNNGNTVVKFSSGGFAVFSMYTYIDRYPIISSMVDNFKLEKVCNSAVVKDALDKLAPMTAGENNKRVGISNIDNKLTISFSSVVNGTATYKIRSECKENFEIGMQQDFLRNIPLSFDIYIDTSRDINKFILRHEDVYIIITASS